MNTILNKGKSATLTELDLQAIVSELICDWFSLISLYIGCHLLIIS